MIRNFCLIVVFFLIALGSGIAGQRRLDEYALILNAPAAAQGTHARSELKSVQAQARLRVISAQQNSVRAELARRKIPVSGAVQLLLNAVFVRVPHGQQGRLAGIPGVRTVAYLPPLRRQLDQAVNLVRATDAWSLVGGTGNAGAGIKIAIIDSGIDQTQPAFQDSSLSVPATFPNNDLAFTNNKVIVARSYIDQISGTVPQYTRPDDFSPRDRSGHGTAVAMIAAGNTTSGPHGTITGIAPKAWLGNYKVFGTPGVNDFTSGSSVFQALSDAFSDGMDIAVLPFGTQPVYGPLATDCGGICDQYAFAMEQAVDNMTSGGMLVVVSAGNDGSLGTTTPALGTVTTPGITPAALTVGALTNGHVLFSNVKLNGSNVPGNLANIDAAMGDGPRPPGALTAPLKDVSQLQNDGLACSSLPGGSLNGSVALIQRGNCSFSDKINNAQSAGAVGVLLYQSSGNETPFRQLGATDTGIPAFMIGYSHGAAVKQFVQANSGVTVTLDPNQHTVSTTPNIVAADSSRGPAIGTLDIKPEVAAIGFDIYTAVQTTDPYGDLYDPSGFRGVSGTSFAAPMVAGAAALVLQKNTSLTSVNQLQSTIINTATSGVSDVNGTASVTAVGAGELNVAAAVAAPLAFNPPTLSANTPSAIQVTNISGSAAFVSVAVSSSNPILNVAPTTLQLNPGATATVLVTFTNSQPPPGSYEGAVTFTAGNTTMRVPYLYLVGDGQPNNLLAIRNQNFFGVANDPSPCDQNANGYVLALKALDRYGVPITNAPVQFTPPTGSTVLFADANTDILGIAAASVCLGPQTGDRIFTASVGGLSTQFDAYVRPQYPAINSGGVVDAAKFQAGNGMAPGSYISIFGTGLSDATASLTANALPLGLANVSAGFDLVDSNNSVTQSFPGGLWFVSQNQINLQIPWELKGQSSAQLKVSLGSFSSDLYTVPLTTYSPGIFAVNGFAIAQDENYDLIDHSNPARRGGKFIVIYANGLGPVDNTPPSGQPTPDQPLASTTMQATATIGGKPARVLFSGLTPGSIGLYQVNVEVPPDAPTGDQDVVISIGGASSPAVKMPVQ